MPITGGCQKLEDANNWRVLITGGCQ